MINKLDKALWNNKTDNKLAENLCLWNEVFMVAYDKSEDYSCLAICNFELFSLLCTRCRINCVLLPTTNLIDYVNSCNAHNWEQSSSYNIIEVEDN